MARLFSKTAAGASLAVILLAVAACGGHGEDKSDPAGRVAYLVVHKAEDPIEIDVGQADSFAEWFITDGNHRFAAALLRGDQEILCSISGCPEYIEHFFGLDRLGAMPVQPAKQP